MLNSTVRSNFPFAVLAFVVLFALAGCGGPSIGAVVGDGDVKVRTVDGTATAAGPVAFPNGAVLVADGAGQVRVTAGGKLGVKSTTDGSPGPGIVDFHLESGAQVKRREGPAFDLVAGAARLHAGPLTARVIVFHGAAFLEIQTKNTGGVDVRVSADGEELTVEVTKGEVLLHSPVSTPKDLHFVVLGPGEAASATPGSEPVKHAAGD